MLSDLIAQRHMQRGTVFGIVNVLAGEHAPNAFLYAALLRQRAQQLQCLPREALLGKIVEQTFKRKTERSNPLRIFREQFAQRFLCQRLTMRFKIPPCLRTRQHHELSLSP